MSDEVIRFESGNTMSPRESIQDAKLLRKAAQRRWNVPDAAKSQVIDTMTQILAPGSKCFGATKVQAARVILEANQQDIDIDMAEDKANDGQSDQVVHHIHEARFQGQLEKIYGDDSIEAKAQEIQPR